MDFFSSLLGIAKKKIKPVNDFLNQSNTQRQELINSNVNKYVPDVPMLRPIAKAVGNFVMGDPEGPRNLFPKKPYKEWTPDQKQKLQDYTMNLVVGMSGGMENKAAGILQKANPKGLLTESAAQTAFRREAQLAPEQVYTKFKVNHPLNPQQTDIVSSWGKDVKAKVNISDYLKTPENVLTKLGLADESKYLRTGWEAYRKELPEALGQITGWMKEAPSPESSTRIFNWLDGKKVDLAPNEEFVATKIKWQLSRWADRLKLPKDERVSNYITHLFEKGKIGKEFDPEVARIIESKIPSSVYDPFLKKRIDVPEYKTNVWEALDAYTKRAVRKVHMDEPLEKLATAAEKLDVESYKYVQRYASRINLRPTEIDNLIDNFIKTSPVGYSATVRPTAYITSKIRGQVYRGALGLNVGSALRNLTQGVNTFSKLGTRYTTSGYLDLAKRWSTGNLDELYKTGVLDDNILSDRGISVFKGILQKVDNGLFSLFDAAEKINRGSAYFGAKKMALAKGMDEAKAIEFAKDMVRQTQFSYAAIDSPVAMSGDLAKTLLQFKTFDLKQLEFLGNMAKNKEWGGLLRYIGASLVTAASFGKLVGMDASDFVPFFNSVKDGRFQSPTQQIASNVKDLLIGNEGQKEKAKKDLPKTAALLIPGGVQAKKTIEGLQAFKEGASETSTGRERFDVPKTAENLVRSALFGQYSLPEAREYFKNIDLGKSKSEVAFEKWKSLNEKDPKKAQEFGRTLSPSMQSELRSLLKEEKLQITDQEKKWKSFTIEKRAEEMAKILKKYPKGTKERAEVYNRWKSLGLVSERLYEELILLQRKGAF